MKLIAVPLLLILPFLAAATQPVPKFPIAKDTTYLSGPLDKEGFVDYEAALNEYAGKGVTPDKNANVLLWKALGPTSFGDFGMPAEFFQRLGMEVPPKNGDYFIGMSAYQKLHKLDNRQMSEVLDQLDRCGKRPWQAKDLPHLAAFL